MTSWPRFLGAAVIAGALSLLGCDGSPRSLVLIDGTPEGAKAEVASRVADFARRGRPVQVLRVGGAAAVDLAARGEGEAALVPIDAALGDFVISGRGREAGRIKLGGAEVRVLEIDGKLHPKVDPEGARALAAFFASP